MRFVAFQVVLGWSMLLLFVAVQLLRPLLSSWIGVAWITGSMVTVFFLMQVFILFTQSERSTPAKRVARDKDKVVNGRQ